MIILKETIFISPFLATPFNVKNQQQSAKFNTHTSTNMNFATPPSHQQQQQSHPLSNDQWAGPLTSTVNSNHVHMQPQHQQSHGMNIIQPMSLQHQQSINNK
jgi:hypothetical protein